MSTISTWGTPAQVQLCISMTATSSISELIAYQIYDSRGQPTLEAQIQLSSGNK